MRMYNRTTMSFERAKIERAKIDEMIAVFRRLRDEPETHPLQFTAEAWLEYHGHFGLEYSYTPLLREAWNRIFMYDVCLNLERRPCTNKQIADCLLYMDFMLN